MRRTPNQNAGERRPVFRIPGAARWIVVAMLIALSTSFGVVLGAGMDRSGDAGASTMLTQLSEFTVVEETYDAIREHYVLSDEISDEELMYGAASGMVEALGDTGHSTFLDPEEAEDFQRESRGELIGIGIQLDLSGSQPIVIAPVGGSPAYEAGIESGDVIIAVGDTATADVEPEDVADLIRGEAGTDVTMTLRHEDELEPYTVTITRANITIEPVSSIMMPDHVLWLRVVQFSAGATEGVKDALEYGKEHDMTGVILDLRNNPGGLVFEAIGVGSQFLPGGSVLYQEQDADGDVHKITTIGNNGAWQSGNLVVLINEGSASAAEIVSSGLQANERAKLYGETTFGTGTVLLPIDLSGGSVALLGTKLWLTADGDQIWKQGVDPDVEVTLEPGVSPVLPIEYDKDSLSQQDVEQLQDQQLLRAYDAITGNAAVATP